MRLLLILFLLPNITFSQQYLIKGFKNARHSDGGIINIGFSLNPEDEIIVERLGYLKIQHEGVLISIPEITSDTLIKFKVGLKVEEILNRQRERDLKYDEQLRSEYEMFQKSGIGECYFKLKKPNKYKSKANELLITIHAEKTKYEWIDGLADLEWEKLENYEGGYVVYLHTIFEDHIALLSTDTNKITLEKGALNSDEDIILATIISETCIISDLISISSN